MAKPKNEPYTEIVDITPEMAAELLQKNQNNRPMKWHIVKEMSNKMKAHEWVFTNQGIGFNVDGILSDGQHRLAAIIDSGVPQKFNVTYNLPQEAFDHIDTGGTRSASDLLSRRLPQVKDKKTLCSGAGMMLRGIVDQARRPDKIEIVDFAETQAELISEFIEILARGESRRLLRKAAILAAFCNAVRMPDKYSGGHGARDRETVQIIAMRLANQTWDDNDPMKTLFNKLLRDELDAQKHGKIADMVNHYAICVAAIRAALNGKSYTVPQSTSIEWGYSGDLVKSGTGANIRGRPKREKAE